MANTAELEKIVTMTLREAKELPTEEQLEQKVRDFAQILGDNPLYQGPFSDVEIEEVVRCVITKHDIRMEAGALFEAEEYRPWLAGRQGEIDWFYWQRYRDYLISEKGFPPPVVQTLDEVTHKILDRLEDPLKEGAWDRRGLVVGHVQSGKTANFTGLLCKAADAGYKVIIVLAGMLNSLRNQTQERIDFDFMGYCTRQKKFVGVGLDQSDDRTPVCFTTSVDDFNRRTANVIAMRLGALNVPVVLVLKKNKSTLENLHKWLVDQNRYNLKDFPMLMVDDEADHASVNTNKPDKDPTAINKAIRDLLALFPRSSMVGYTATPFANIFIDPEDEHEMTAGENFKDLFPKDFILSLDPPTNYVGPDRIFVDGGNLNHCVQPIDDYEDYLPLRHKIDFDPTQLPPSLAHALNVFVIARAMRLLRGQDGKHHSMMVNASRFTIVQLKLKRLVLERVMMLRQAIGNYAALSPDQALQDSMMLSLHRSWIQEFKDLVEFDWPEIQEALKEAVDPVEVICVNSASTSGEALDYSSSNYPAGRSVIAVGGLGLSRGLTLEGLLVSYFLRNSVMYDTLMQMGRWFGYREGYADLCRIYMPEEASAWYAHIAEATEEMREDFRRMEQARMTPVEFGLKVKSHPAALEVTARNKMRRAMAVPVQIDLQGRLAETSVVYGNRQILEANKQVLERLVAQASQAVTPVEESLGWIWKGIDPQLICAAIEGFQNHPICMLTDSRPLVEYITKEFLEKNIKFDILLRSVDSEAKPVEIGGLSITPPMRKIAGQIDSQIAFSKRRVASKGDERAGLTPDQVEAAKHDAAGTENIPDKAYRKVEGRSPLFMLNFCRIDNEDASPDLLVPTFGVSFPGDSGDHRQARRLVEYMVTPEWWRNNYIADVEEEEADA